MGRKYILSPSAHVSSDTWWTPDPPWLLISLNLPWVIGLSLSIPKAQREDYISLEEGPAVELYSKTGQGISSLGYRASEPLLCATPSCYLMPTVTPREALWHHFTNINARVLCEQTGVTEIDTPPPRRDSPTISSITGPTSWVRDVRSGLRVRCGGQVWLYILWLWWCLTFFICQMGGQGLCVGYLMLCNIPCQCAVSRWEPHLFCSAFWVLSWGGFPPDSPVSWKESSMSTMASISYPVVWKCQCKWWCGWALGVSSSNRLSWTCPQGSCSVSAARDQAPWWGTFHM